MNKITSMSNELLLPNKFKTIGWLLLIPATIAGTILSFTDFETNWLHTKVFAMFSDEAFGLSRPFSFIHVNVTNTIVGTVFIAGALLVGFSKEKKEDEFIAKLRLSSLLWAILVNYILLLFAFVFIYGTAFFTVMIYNMFTVMIIFIIRFNYILYKNSKIAAHEE